MPRTVVLLAALLALCFAPAVADEPKKASQGPPAEQLLAEGLANAKKDGKGVFLAFGSPTCGWCKVLDKYHADPEVEKVVGKHLLHVKVDIVTNPGGEAMYKKYGTDRGVPAFAILDADAKVLADSGDGKDNVGFPAEPHEIAHYLKVMKAACPKLTDAEIELLTKKLKDARSKK